LELYGMGSYMAVIHNLLMLSWSTYRVDGLVPSMNPHMF
jgi:hypothetical protein